MQYIPKYVRQESDLLYGEKVTHENYNEKLNLNTTQGDYNTMVLDSLFNDVETGYRIKYVDKKFEEVDDVLEDHTNKINTLSDKVDEVYDDVAANTNNITNLINGTTKAGHAQIADVLDGLSSCGPSRYYGTDAHNNQGFIPLPEFVYAEPMSGTTEITGVYYVPMLNSVAEDMLTEEVRTKLNTTGITDYDYLDNRPQINSVTLTGNLALSDLGIQAAGDFVTNSALANMLADYYTAADTDSAISTATTGMATQSWVSGELSSYATTSALATVSTKASNAAVIQVGSTFSGTPKNGDLLITV